MIYCAPLPDRSLFRLGGNEATDFLHNLVTCDVMKLRPGDVTFGALLSPQGKVMFDFHILREDESFLFDVCRAQRDALMKRLGFYKLRAAITLEELDDMQVFARWGVEITQSDGRRPEMGERVYGVELDSNSDTAAYRTHRMSVGVPASGVDFVLDTVFPHDVLMDQFTPGGVDFTKGCYVGQEVVSRMKHRNSARNRFVKVAGDDLPDMGTTLTVNDRQVGVMGGSGGNNGLALVRVDKIGKALDAGDTVLADGHEVKLSFQEFATFGWDV